MLRLFPAPQRRRSTSYLLCSASSPSAVSCSKCRSHTTTYQARLIAHDPNHKIIQDLTESMKKEESSVQRNDFKILAFRRAITEIGRLKEPIVSVEQAQNIPGVGVGISRRIQEFLVPGSTAKSYPKRKKLHAEHRVAEHPSDAERIQAELQKVPGIGVVKAKRLYEAGCRSIDDLKKSPYHETLKHSVQTSLFFINQLDDRVSREQSEVIKAAIEEEISGTFRVELGGHYRRGLESSPDLDLIIFDTMDLAEPEPPVEQLLEATPAKMDGPAHGRKPIPFRPETYMTQRTESCSRLLQDIVPLLSKRGLIAGMFRSGSRRWEGIARIPKYERYEDGFIFEDPTPRLAAIRDKVGVFKKLNITCVPMKGKGAALLALTGDAQFVRHVRNAASHVGLLLNDGGLWQWRPNAEASEEESCDDAATGSYLLLPCSTEAEIFTQVGMEYVEPEKRNFAFVFNESDSSPKKRGPKPKIVSL